MQFFNKLNPFFFILSFAIGIYLVYITTPTPNILYKYPNPNDNTIYQDLANNCYKYKSEKVECKNPKKFSTQFI